MKFSVTVFPGSNCDHDCEYVIRDVMGQEVEMIWHKETDLRHPDCVVVPGGFSYGDYLRTGAIARFSPVMKSVADFAAKGGLVIGICNGFQILCEAGLLPGALIRNKSLQFICKNIYIKVEQTDTPFTNACKPGQVLKTPIAHGEGNYFIDSSGLNKLEENRQIVVRYCDSQGAVSAESNPNGSLENIAGICNLNRNVFGLMPHPDRSGEDILGSHDGQFIWKSILAAKVGAR
ncbi:MAG TPA: phosphoribosylformylglycinamidine synthase subunit PurQ [bacterium]|jgi:phosphoribosylformylglycinamidine synthase I|nr:phosphoribosylformylglycinamidine synthase subunit PurQ [bacterium]